VGSDVGGGCARKMTGTNRSRNHGVKNSSPGLFEATGLFEIFKAENGQSYAADKRNAERTPRPDR
jgi:hypothetical protein